MGAALVAVLLVPGGARAAAWLPDVAGTAGSTFAVTGTPSGGGGSISLGALWPVEHGLSFGLGLFADDLGEQMGRLTDPKDGSDLGAVSVRHRWALAGAWRLDARLVERGPWRPYASATWGYYRVRDDVRGVRLGNVGSTGFSLAGGLRWAATPHSAFGGSVRYHRLFNDRAGRYVSAGIDWSWR